MEISQGSGFNEVLSSALAGGFGLLWIIGTIVLWLVVAIITAMIAKSKGYSSAGGFFAGLFLGGIGMLIYGCMADAISQQHLARIAQLLGTQAQRPTAPPPAG